MSVDPVAALEEGAKRLVTVPGAVVAGFFVLAGLLELPVWQTLSTHIWDRLLQIPEVREGLQDQYGSVIVPDNPLALGLDLPTTLGALAVLFLVVAALRIVGIRVFAAEDAASVPFDDVTANVLRVFAFVVLFEIAVTLLMGALIGGPALAVGALSGPSPGSGATLAMLGAYLLVLALLVAIPILLYFARQRMAIDGENTISAVRQSYRITRTNLAPIFILLATIFVLGAVGDLGLGMIFSPGEIGMAISTVYQRIVAVFGVAVATRAYLQTQ